MFEHEFHLDDLVLDAELIIEAASVVLFVSVHVTCFGKSHMYRSSFLVEMTRSASDFSLPSSVFLPVSPEVNTFFQGRNAKRLTISVVLPA